MNLLLAKYRKMLTVSMLRIWQFFGFKFQIVALSLLLVMSLLKFFCKESIECFPGTVSTYVFSLLVIIPVG
jgi:hypothetical protein